MFIGCGVKFDKKFTKDLMQEYINTVPELTTEEAIKYTDNTNRILHANKLIINGISGNTLSFEGYDYLFKKNYFFIVEKLRRN